MRLLPFPRAKRKMLMKEAWCTSSTLTRPGVPCSPALVQDKKDTTTHETDDRDCNYRSRQTLFTGAHKGTWQECAAALIPFFHHRQTLRRPPGQVKCTVMKVSQITTFPLLNNSRQVRLSWTSKISDLLRSHNEGVCLARGVVRQRTYTHYYSPLPMIAHAFVSVAGVKDILLSSERLLILTSPPCYVLSGPSILDPLQTQKSSKAPWGEWVWLVAAPGTPGSSARICWSDTTNWCRFSKSGARIASYRNTM